MAQTQAASTGRGTRVAVLLGLAAWAVCVGLGQLGVWRFADTAVYDALVRTSPAIPRDPRVATVYVGDADIEIFHEQYGRWPWRTRALHALAARVMLDGGARALGYDILFCEPSLDPDHSDDQLAIELAVRDDGVDVVHGVLFETTQRALLADRTPSESAAEALAAAGGSFGTTPEERDSFVAGRAPLLPIDTLYQASTALGHLNPSPDHDHAVRRVPLLVRHGDRLVPSLALGVAMATLGVEPQDIDVDVPGREIRLTTATGGVVHVPIDPDGTTWIHYDRPKEDFPAILYSRLDQAREDGLLEGASVIVGVSVSGATDTWRTPLDPQHQGFLIQAQILENLLTGRFVRAVQPDRSPFAWPELGIHVALLVASVLLALVTGRSDPRVGWPLTFVTAALPLATSAVLLRASDTWLPTTTASASLGLAGLLGVGYRQLVELMERRHLRRVYERYLSPAVLESVLHDPSLLELGGARKELTIFFSDIRGFTPYSETVGPTELTERLNQYYGEMIDIAHRHGATVDKLIGDSLMAFYGDPVPQPDHALRAVRTAVDTQERLRELAAEWRARGAHVFDVGIGIATGEVSVGNLGSTRFVDYTVVGSVVNLAARLQGAASPGEVLICPRTRELVGDAIVTEDLGERSFTGIAGPIRVFRVAGLRSL